MGWCQLTVFFLERALSRKEKGQVKGKVCPQPCASQTLATQMFHIPYRRERNPDHPNVSLELILSLNLT